MSRFNRPTANPQRSVIQTLPADLQRNTRTHEGAPGLERDEKSEVFLLGVSNFWNVDAFYERGQERDNRFIQLIRKLAISDPQWTAGFLAWLRTEANMRTVALVGAAEFVNARLARENALPAEIQKQGSGVNRQVVNSVLVRPDEPAEMLAYWMNRYGRRLPAAIKRGVADAAKRLYNEYALLKYDTASHEVRFGDVLELTHPTAKADWQGHLYKYALDRRHSRDIIAMRGEALPMIDANGILRASAQEDLRVLLNADALKAAGMTWEDVLSLAGDKLPKKELWEAIIPSMGVMALVRNLRNFEQAGISQQSIMTVTNKLMDAEAVRRSRILPFQIMTALRHLNTFEFQRGLEVALNASLANVPALDGKTLILVDKSGSMQSRGAGTMSELTLHDAAKTFAAALALRAEKVTLVEFAGQTTKIDVPQGISLLKLVEKFRDPNGSTLTRAAVDQWQAGHDRIVILTDEQAGYASPWGVMSHYTYGSGFVDQSVPASTKMYVFNLAGYRTGMMPTGVKNRHALGGLTDASFRMLSNLEMLGRTTWPWENN